MASNFDIKITSDLGSDCGYVRADVAEVMQKRMRAFPEEQLFHCSTPNGAFSNLFDNQCSNYSSMKRASAPPGSRPLFDTGELRPSLGMIFPVRFEYGVLIGDWVDEILESEIDTELEQAHLDTMIE